MELEKRFMELKDRELKDREEKLRKRMREREKLFKKLIIVSKDDMGTFGEQEMKKKLK